VLHAPKSTGRRSKRNSLIQKPNCAVHSRVRAVGPEHFGILAVDCAKHRSRWMLADFYGKVLAEPRTVERNRNALDACVNETRVLARRHELNDLVVVVERTGNYHNAPKRAWRDAGYEVRVVDPFVTSSYRRTTHPGKKTDDTDLGAIVRAAAAGFGRLEVQHTAAFERLQVVSRHRRDLVGKNAKLRCQIAERLHWIWPGYADCFDDVFASQIALVLPEHFLEAEEIRAAGLQGIAQKTNVHHIKRSTKGFLKVLLWAASRPPRIDHADLHRRVLLDLTRDYRGKLAEIKAAELEMARLLVQTEYVVLMSICGINVVTAADLAAEAGPIVSYGSARALSGRSGLYPSRYQSDSVDRKNGPLVRCGNRRLRQALMRISDTLINCNDYYGAMAKSWKEKGVSGVEVHVRIAGRFCRVLHAMTIGGLGYRHPCCGDRDYIIQKLIKFYEGYNQHSGDTLCDLQSAAQRLPSALKAEEAAVLTRDLAAARDKRGAGPRRLCEILPEVLARLGVAHVESESSGETISTP
jgi:transposase